MLEHVGEDEHTDARDLCAPCGIERGTEARKVVAPPLSEFRKEHARDHLLHADTELSPVVELLADGVRHAAGAEELARLAGREHIDHKLLAASAADFGGNLRRTHGRIREILHVRLKGLVRILLLHRQAVESANFGLSVDDVIRALLAVVTAGGVERGNIDGAGHAWNTCAYLVSTTFGLPLTLLIFSFNFFHVVHRPGAAISRHGGDSVAASRSA